MTAKSNAQLLTDIQNYKTDPEPDRQAIANTVEDVIDSHEQKELAVTVGAESADDIDLTVQLVSSDGSTSLAEQRGLRFECYDSDGLLATNTAFNFSAVGTGTAVTNTGEAALFVNTDASGTAVVTLTDAGGASDQSVYVKIEGFGGRFETELIPVTFDAS